MRVKRIFATALGAAISLAAAQPASAQYAGQLPPPSRRLPAQSNGLPPVQPDGQGGYIVPLAYPPQVMGDPMIAQTDYGQAAIAAANAPPEPYPYPELYGDQFPPGMEEPPEERDRILSIEAMTAEFTKPENSLIGFRRVVPFDPLNPNLFPAQRVENIYDDRIDGDGLRLRWGCMSAEDRSIMFTGYWASSDSDTKTLGPRSDINLPLTLFNRAGIPVNDGSVDFDGNLQGVTVRYDRGFKLDYDVETAGTTMQFMRQPWMYYGGLVRVRPLGGIRYMYLRESFGLEASDSAYEYTINPITNRPTSGTVLPNPNGNDPFTSELDMRVRTNLVGPEIGVNYEIGGQRFKMTGQTSFAWVANIERIRLRGNEFGDGYTNDFANLNTSFYSSETFGHSSPLFEQSVNIEVPLFNLIPLTALHEVTFRAGINYMIVGEVARPTDSIVYNGWPRIPDINPGRSNWSMTNYTFGLVWVH